MTYDTWVSNTADIDAWYGEPDEELRRQREYRDMIREDEYEERAVGVLQDDESD